MQMTDSVDIMGRTEKLFEQLSVPSNDLDWRSSVPSDKILEITGDVQSSPLRPPPPYSVNDIERVLNKVSPEPNTGCWLWMGASTDKGYGTISVNGRTRYVHRIMYEVHIGTIPVGLELDHKCRTTMCVNPDHLEPVTHEENCKRGNWLTYKRAASTHCMHGHEFTEKNTYIRKEGRRQCRACGLNRDHARRRLSCGTETRPS